MKTPANSWWRLGWRWQLSRERISEKQVTCLSSRHMLMNSHLVSDEILQLIFHILKSLFHFSLIFLQLSLDICPCVSNYANCKANIVASSPSLDSSFSLLTSLETFCIFAFSWASVATKVFNLKIGWKGTLWCDTRPSIILAWSKSAYIK